MKRLFAALLTAALLVPAGAWAQFSIGVTPVESGSSHLEVAYPQHESSERLTQDEQLAVNTQMGMMGMIMNMRLKTAEAAQAAKRAGADIDQRAQAYQDGSLASVALIWNGMQEDGRKGSSVKTVTLSLETGMEITFDQLFSDAQGAQSVMEALIEREILGNMNTYVEIAELLPMPTDSFSLDEAGLTVYYDDSRYRMFDGTCGAVTFYWHEIAAFIGEDSPVYALSRPQAASAQAIRSAEGFFGRHELLGLYRPLGEAMEAYALTDEPDYTASAVLYALQQPQLRGCSVEIPRYAETPEEETPISAVRHSRISWNGLTTGVSTREEIAALLGEPDEIVTYGEDAAYDMLLEPGESLVYACDNGQYPMVLEAHCNESGVLSCLILRDAMPESLY